jgi:tRNA C32,U32 (ribose-2'-O)-methylase TrmJ
MKEAKIYQEMSRIHEQMEKNNGIALKSSLKEKEKTMVESSSSKKKENDNESDEDMALFIKRFKKVMKKDGYFNNNKRRGKITRRSNKSCFG